MDEIGQQELYDFNDVRFTIEVRYRKEENDWQWRVLRHAEQLQREVVQAWQTYIPVEAGVVKDGEMLKGPSEAACYRIGFEHAREWIDANAARWMGDGGF